MNIRVNIVFVETHQSIVMIQRYHEYFREVYAIIVAKTPEVNSNSILQMIFKTLNDSIDLDDLILTFVVFGAYSRMTEMNVSSPTIIINSSFTESIPESSIMSSSKNQSTVSVDKELEHETSLNSFKRDRDRSRKYFASIAYLSFVFNANVDLATRSRCRL